MYKPTTAMWQPSASVFFKITLLSSALAALGMTTGCSSTQSATTVTKSNSLDSGYLDASSLDSLEDLLSATDMRAVEGDRLLILKHGDVWKRMTVGFKMDLNHWDPRIEAQRSWFISRQPYLDRLSARASRYLYHTVKEAERRGLPTELALLPVIESSYDPAATSSAAAAGLWQFIPSTGRIYGLKQTGMYDGRRDVVESTRAAYEFLGSLYNQFGSWELALAAYNAGPGRIQQAINRNKAAGLPTDYWSLKLPQETMNYVPRFLAVAQIIKNPQAYNVSLPPIANRPHFREVQVPGDVSLNEISALTGLSRAELYSLNPGYRGEQIDPSSPMRILIPADISPAVDSKLRRLKANTGLLASTQPVLSDTTTTINVKPVESSSKNITPAKTTPPPLLASVTPTKTAEKSSVSSAKKMATPRGSDALAAFAASADIPSAPRIPVAVTPASNIQPVKVEPPISAQEREQILAAVKVEGQNKSIDEVLQPQASQAEKDEVVAELKALAPQGTEIVDPYDGKIKLTAIQTSQSVAEQQGQEVSKRFAYPKTLAETTPVDSEEAKLNRGKNYVKTDAEVVVVPPKGKRSTYTVMTGDTLALIAMKNGVNWRDVAKWNQIDPNATLYVGITLYLYDAKPQVVIDKPSKKIESKPETYLVKANDSLTSVASQFDVSIQELAEWNDLTVNSGLFVGQKLSLKETADSREKTTNKSSVQATKRAATQLYTVKRGEYLKLLADRYALSNQELADLTPGLTANSSLMVGQKINVPLSTETANIEAPSTEKTRAAKTETKAQPSYKTESYKVQRGDTLYSIAAQSKISLTELAELNDLSNSSGLRVGQSIKIPAGSSIPESYVVQPGDTLIGLASRYNLQPDYVAQLNGLSRSAGLRAGQKIKLSGEIPVVVKKDNKAEIATAEIHVVKSGETLTSIANKYHLQLNYLAELNGLSRNSPVRVGQRLKLEGDVAKKVDSNKAESVKETSVKTVVKAVSKNTEKYTVKAGDSLTVIAGRVGMSVKELADLNDLNPRTTLQRGQSIIIPKTITEYTVKRGDTLIGLASKYGLQTQELAELNDLQPNTQLRIGAVIKVPNL